MANEEIVDGLSERGNHPVVRIPLRQWVLKITDYAEKLLHNIDHLDWPAGTISAQKQWIGRSTGTNVRFFLDNSSSVEQDRGAAVEGSVAHSAFVEVFTTRADTLMGATYLVMAPEHDMVMKVTPKARLSAVMEYVRVSSSKSDLERTATGNAKAKTGIALGVSAIHPLSGERLPIWISDFVLAGYGTGVIMGVPAHDNRDYEFACKFDLPVKQVVVEASQYDISRGAYVAAAQNNFSNVEGEVLDRSKIPFTLHGTVVNSGPKYDGLSSTEAARVISLELKDRNMGHETVSYKLRDWVFSRQRYWGEPIPIYFPVEMLTSKEDASPISGDAHRILYDQPIAMSDSDLPLNLPALEQFLPSDDPAGVLAKVPHWRYFECDGKWFARETNTMPQVNIYACFCSSSVKLCLCPLC